MTSKYQYYADMASEQTKQVTRSMENWTDFLSSAGRLYKYPFEEQLMIHKQRPNAIACAPLEIWNRPMNRFIKRGSKGIALLDNLGGKQKLKYVFDVADTHSGKQNAYSPFIWEGKPEYESIIIEALEKEILALEDTKTELSKRFEPGETPPEQSDYEEYAAIDEKLAELYAQWEALIE